MSIADKLKGVKLPQSKKRNTPLWKGPTEDGITQSLLSRFLVCRERFRLKVIEGLAPEDRFSHYREYGDMWHVCEEDLAKTEVLGKSWLGALKDYCQGLCRQYPTEQEKVDHWYNVCKVQFPLYVDYWKQHPDVKERIPLLQEQVFNVPYQLPSGRIVRLRGKWDSVDLIGKRNGGIYLQENKSKGDIYEEQLKRQLRFDLQTMLYLVALHEYQYPTEKLLKEGQEAEGPEEFNDHKILGVRYNVIRRPLSGGKGSIRRHQPSKSNPQGESKADFYARVAQYIKDEPEFFFMRWKVEISDADIDKFKREFLNPVLEQLCDWYEWIVSVPKENLWDHPEGIHSRHPYGVYNVLDEGGSSDFDEYMDNGSMIGLRQVESLFGELQ